MQLENFTRDEFQGWWDRLDPKLLARIDVLRFRWGKSIRISPIPGAVGRDKVGSSQHDWKPRGYVTAVDTLPRGLIVQSDALEFKRLAIECGFTGIGLYPDWNPSCGFHLDTRTEEKMGAPATWGAYYDDRRTQHYISFEEALQLLLE